MAWKEYENMALEYHAEADRLLKIRNALKKKKRYKTAAERASCKRKIELLGSMITSCYNSEQELNQIAKNIKETKT